MAETYQGNPTRFHSVISSLVLLGLSLAFAPFTFIWTLIFYIWALFNGTLISNSNLASKRAVHKHAGENSDTSNGLHFSAPSEATQKTVLITGARMFKAIALARIFKRAGHRVILSDEEMPAMFCAARFSEAVDAFCVLPDPGISETAYIKALCNIVEQNQVDLWIPCSSLWATVDDAKAAQTMQNLGIRCITFVPPPDLCTTLHEKDAFMELCKTLQITIPEYEQVTSVDAAMSYLYSSNVSKHGHRYLVKSITCVSDALRSDRTLVPLATPEDTRDHLKSAPVPISEAAPVVLQRFVEGLEFATQAQVRGGELVSFVCCRSSDMLMRYVDVRRTGEAIIGEEAEEWVRIFLEKWGAVLGQEKALLTGHLSFDFIWEEKEERLYVIECNPRVHTAITLLSNCPPGELANAYLSTSSGPPADVLRPRIDEPPHSWLAHAIPLSLQTLVPSTIRPLLNLIHPLHVIPASNTSTTQSPAVGESPPVVLLRYLRGVDHDPFWDPTDPWPWWALAHIHFPWILMRSIWTGKGWSRLNVSTARVWAL